MTLQQDNSKNFDQEQEKNTVRYLRNHPGFFERHRDLLADMVLPHESGKAVSLIERQVSILREQKDEHKKKLQFLIANAQQNEQLITRLNQLILDIMDTQSLDQLLNLVEHRLRSDFSADEVIIRLLNSSVQPDKASWSAEQLAAFEQVTGKRKPLCGHLKPEQMQALFQDAAEKIQSVALLPLVYKEDSKQSIGLLAIGSSDGARFSADMDTLFLSHLAKVLTRVINQHLKD
ncbi:MAG: DUF484 family protein [Thioalkalispiraceae bacterium]|jgi:uncharacterized protein YigA (DUF484 family)